MIAKLPRSNWTLWILNARFHCYEADIYLQSLPTKSHPLPKMHSYVLHWWFCPDSNRARIKHSWCYLAWAQCVIGFSVLETNLWHWKTFSLILVEFSSSLLIYDPPLHAPCQNTFSVILINMEFYWNCESVFAHLLQIMDSFILSKLVSFFPDAQKEFCKWNIFFKITLLQQIEIWKLWPTQNDMKNSHSMWTVRNFVKMSLFFL